MDNGRSEGKIVAGENGLKNSSIWSDPSMASWVALSLQRVRIVAWKICKKHLEQEFWQETMLDRTTPDSFDLQAIVDKKKRVLFQSIESRGA